MANAGGGDGGDLGEVRHRCHKLRITIRRVWDFVEYVQEESTKIDDVPRDRSKDEVKKEDERRRKTIRKRRRIHFVQEERDALWIQQVQTLMTTANEVHVNFTRHIAELVSVLNGVRGKLGEAIRNYTSLKKAEEEGASAKGKGRMAAPTSSCPDSPTYGLYNREIFDWLRDDRSTDEAVEVIMAALLGEKSAQAMSLPPLCSGDGENEIKSADRLKQMELVDNRGDHDLIDLQEYGAIGGLFELTRQPFQVVVNANVHFITDVHARMVLDKEIVGGLAGRYDAQANTLYVEVAIPCKAGRDSRTDVEMDTMALFAIKEATERLGLQVVGWYHSHPKFDVKPSTIDVLNHKEGQRNDLEVGKERPWVGLIVGRKRSPSTFCWFRTEAFRTETMQKDKFLPMRLQTRLASGGVPIGVGGAHAREDAWEKLCSQLGLESAEIAAWVSKCHLGSAESAFKDIATRLHKISRDGRQLSSEACLDVFAGYGPELKIVSHAVNALGRYYARRGGRAPFTTPDNDSLHEMMRSLAPTAEQMELPREGRIIFVMEVALLLFSCFSEAKVKAGKRSRDIGCSKRRSVRSCKKGSAQAGDGPLSS